MKNDYQALGYQNQNQAKVQKRDSPKRVLQAELDDEDFSDIDLKLFDWKKNERFWKFNLEKIEKR